MPYETTAHPLIDGVEQNKAHPDTFEIPGDNARANLSIGAYAKIGVNHPKRGGERFWVQVLRTEGTGYVGKVDNDLVIYPELTCSTEIPFGPQHVLQVY